MSEVPWKSAAIAKFMSRVDTSGDCWTWTAGRGSGGYGALWFDGRSDRAHRVSYKLFVDVIPAGMFVCHHCDNRLCVNPRHFFLGDVLANNRDMVAKGRHYKQVLTECAHGHGYTDANTYVTPEGRRSCRTCRADQLSEHRKQHPRRQTPTVPVVVGPKKKVHPHSLANLRPAPQNLKARTRQLAEKLTWSKETGVLITHGRPSSYSVHGCRCDECFDARTKSRTARTVKDSA